MAFPLDNSLVRQHLRDAAERYAALLGRVPDAHAAVPGSEWTVHQVATHVLAALSDYTDSFTGVRPLLETDPSAGPTNAQIRGANAQRMQDIAADDLRSLGDGALAAVQRFLDGTEGRSGDEPYDWYGKAESTLGAMTGLLVGELLLHGRDIAVGLGEPWPIGHPEALSALAGAFALLPAYVDTEAARGVRTAYEINLRGGPTMYVTFDDAAATVGDSPVRRVDCRVNADPVAMLLVSYGRTSAVCAALSGRIVAWSRRPWTALAFPKLLLNP
ncbi:MAG: maleylpyruvate isomerase N-terminal domain-containing protein [Nocardioides sp.]